MSANRTKQKLQSALRQRSDGTLSLLSAFKSFDTDNSGELDYEEFCNALKLCGLQCTPQDTRALFVELDSDCSNSISYEELMRSMRQELSSERRDTITRVFDMLDTDSDGVVSLTDIGSSINIKNHPDVKAGKATVTNKLKDFLTSFGSFSENGFVNLPQFLEYYTNIGAFDDDESFANNMSAMWSDRSSKGGGANNLNRTGGITSLQAFASNVLPNGRVESSSFSTNNEILEKLRSELVSRGGKGFIALQRKFRIMDDDGSKSLNIAEFKKAMKEMNLSLSDQEYVQLFNYFDSDRSGSISFDEFIVAARGPMDQRRKDMVAMAFKIIDKDGDGIVEPEDLVNVYDTSKHPDVLAGKKTPDQVLREFLDTFDVGGDVDGKVTKDEFMNYYANISASIDDDDYFELMIRNAWHISGGKGWAANSANKRVLVTRADGSQYVEEIKNDLGLKQGDKAGMMARLKAQGVDAAQISLSDGIDNTSGAKKTKPAVLGEKILTQKLQSLGLDPTAVNVALAGPQSGGSNAPPPPPSRLAAAAVASSTGLVTPLAPVAAATNSTIVTPREMPNAGVGYIITKLKAALKQKGGGTGFIVLQRKFRIMDDDNSKSLNMSELKKAMKEMDMNLSDSELRMLFDYFDTDHSGSIDFEEFIQGVREPLTERRLRLVQMAFAKIDLDGSGVVDAQEIASLYDPSKHPEVIAGRMTHEQVLRHFLDTFDVGGEVDGKVTLKEFTSYYANLGASIDSDDYFELMIRNAWHISGGEGWSANSANKRVLVTRADGSQYVEEIKNDLGLKQGDKAGMMARLKAQGVDVKDISTTGAVDDDMDAPKVKRPQALSRHASGSASNSGSSASDSTSLQQLPPEVIAAKLGPRISPKVVNLPPPPPPRASTSSIDSAVTRSSIPNAGLQMILNKLKGELRSRGGQGFIALQRKFRIMDDDGSKSLQPSEFNKAMKEMNMGLTDSELRMLFDHFDTDQSKTIDFEEFIQGVREPLTERRLRLVHQAFAKIDLDGSGVVDAQEIASLYDPSKHPEVIAGRMTHEQVLRHFLDTFDVGGEVDGKVTLNEFINYYTNLGASIDSDDYFELMIRNAWHISGGEGWSANSANKRVLVTRADGSQYVEEIKNDLGLKQGDKAGMMARLKAQGVDVKDISTTGAVDDYMDAPKARKPMSKHMYASAAVGVLPGLSSYNSSSSTLPPKPVPKAKLSYKPTTVPEAPVGVKMMIDHLKNELASRGAHGFVGLQRKFRIMDDDNSKSLDLSEFKKAMKEMNMGLSDVDIRVLFEYFDTDHTGTIDFEEFTQGVRDPLTERRLRLVHQAFAKIDLDGSGVVDAQEIASLYDPSKHPEVIAGRMTHEQVLRHFLDTFDVGGEVDGKVTLNEFINYYTNLGASIDSDDYFELMIRNAWHISGGEGWSANSANKRVLVTRADGSQYVEEIKNDLGLKQGDKAGMMARLKAQGVDAAQISLYDGGDDGVGADKKMTAPVKKAPEVFHGSFPHARKGSGGSDNLSLKSTVFSSDWGNTEAPVTGRRQVESQNKTMTSNLFKSVVLNQNVPVNESAFSNMKVANKPANRSFQSSLFQEKDAIDVPLSQKPVTKKPQKDPDFGLQPIINKLKKEIKERCGGHYGFHALQRKFRIMDDDGTRSLDLAEFKKAMKEMNFSLSDMELRCVFEYFDVDQSKSIDFEEFIQGMREPLDERRQALINLAFSSIDTDGSGVIEADELLSKYDASRHPDVIAGKKTANQVLKEWMSTFEVGGEVDGHVTLAEFVNYYHNLSASIDSDDYFELMIRNAWHISGGEGWSANSANKRVLVTRADGSQYVEEIKNDLGLKQGDKAGMMARLKAQGVDAAQISLYDGGDDGVGADKKMTAPRRQVPNRTFTSSITFGDEGKKNSSSRPTTASDASSYAAGASSDSLGSGQGRRHSSAAHRSQVFIGDDSTKVTANAVSNALPRGTGNRGKTLMATLDYNPNVDVEQILASLKEQLASRGARGFVGLQRKFRIIDDDGSQSLSLPEFKKAMKECALDLSEEQLRALFAHFDTDKSGDIDFEEFIQGLKGPMSSRRKRLVSMAFAVLDKDGNGIIEPADIMGAYDASKHPDVLAGKRTPAEVLREFLDTFDVGGVVDGKVTRMEFENYYSNVGASIDDDDYFELMIRNAWHISGGEGWSANSANKRVLVTRADGSQYVEEIKNDLGLKQGDKAGMMARLKAQGVDASQISLFDGGDDGVGADKKMTAATNKQPIFASQIREKNKIFSSQLKLA